MEMNHITTGTANQLQFTNDAFVSPVNAVFLTPDEEAPEIDVDMEDTDENDESQISPYPEYFLG